MQLVRTYPAGTGCFLPKLRAGAAQIHRLTWRSVATAQSVSRGVSKATGRTQATRCFACGRGVSLVTRTTKSRPGQCVGGRSRRRSWVRCGCCPGRATATAVPRRSQRRCCGRADTHPVPTPLRPCVRNHEVTISGMSGSRRGVHATSSTVRATSDLQAIRIDDLAQSSSIVRIPIRDRR